MSDIIGKYFYWLITEEKNGKLLSSYRLCIGGLKTHLENKISKSKHLLIFNKDPKWCIALFASAKKLKNKEETKKGELGKDQKKAKYYDYKNRVEICKYFTKRNKLAF